MIGPPVISFYSPLERIGIVSFIIVNSHDITDDNLIFVINLDFGNMIQEHIRIHHQVLLIHISTIIIMQLQLHRNGI